MTMISRHCAVAAALAAALVAALAIAGCARTPPDYSPHYGNAAGRAGRSAVTVPVNGLVPEACMTPDPTETSDLGPFLPPGCANAYNLMRMTERQRDLVYGRRMGRAPGLPTFRAAQQYLTGGERDPGKSVSADK
ncbi:MULTISPECIES: hypothetical protein [Chelatococcus]|uniref:Type IV pilus biogenesis protein CpaD/CtpE n=1 Tax=Chelatococcus caeni TaxID=1348468 RepID=A0A840BUN4_9HYPH|nr:MULTISPECIES: hypothetical protein [Chelatococcus]MBB4017171.1 type IV pilus biogenesis protein CpaD/CtpE [Chelatococcus caeni]